MPPAPPAPEPDIASEVMHLADSLRSAIAGVLLTSDRRLSGTYRIGARPSGGEFPDIWVNVEIREKTPTHEVPIVRTKSEPVVAPERETRRAATPDSIPDPTPEPRTDFASVVSSRAQSYAAPPVFNSALQNPPEPAGRGRRRADPPPGLRGLLH